MRSLPLCATFVAVVLPCLVSAQTTWTGATSSSWDTPSNWDTGSIPGPGDDVIIASAANQPSAYIFGPSCNDLTIQSGATLTLSTGFDLAVGGSLTLDGTLTVVSSSSAVTVVGDWNDNGTYTHAGSRVELTGTGGLGGAVETVFHNLIVSNGTRSATGSFLVEGDATVKDSATLDLGAAVVATVQGSWTSSALGVATTGTGTVELDGTGLLTTGLNGLPNLSLISGTRSVNASTVTGNLTLTGGSLDLLDNATLAVGGNAVLSGGTLNMISTFAGDETLDVEGDATVTAAAGSFSSESRIFCAGNWSSEASFFPSAGSIVLDGAGVRTLGGASPSFFNLRIGAGTVNAVSAVDVDGTLLIDTGATLDADAVVDVAANVVLGAASATWDLGALTHPVAGDWTSAGGSATNGVVDFVGPGNIDAGGGSFDDVVFSSGLRTTGPATVGGDLTLSAGELRIDDAATVAVAGAANLLGGTLSFDDTSGLADILDVEGTLTLNGSLAGTFGASSQIQCAGDVSSLALFTPPAGVLRLDGGTAASVTGITPTLASLRIVSGTKTLAVGAALNGDLRLDNGAALVAAGVLDVEGFATLGDGTATWDLGALSHTVGTDLTSDGATVSNGTLVLDGAAGSIDTGGGTVDNLTVAAGARTVAEASLTGDLVQTGGDVTLDPSATVSVAGAATLSAGTWAMSANSLLDVEGAVDVTGLTAGGMAGASTIRFAADWTASASWIPANGVVIHDGGATASILGPDARFANLTLESGTLTASAPVALTIDLTVDDALVSAAASTVAGNVVVGATGSWDLGGLTHTVSGDWTSSGGSATSGTVEFDMDGDLSTGLGTVPDVDVVGGVRRVFDSTVTGDLELTGGTLRMLDNQGLLVQGNANLTAGEVSWFPSVLGADETLTVEGDVVCNASIEFEGSNSLFFCRGNWTSDGTFAPVSMTVHLDGSGPTTVSGTPNFNNLTITDSTRTFDGPATVVGVLTIGVNGVLDADAALDLNGTVNVSATGSFDVGTSTHTVDGDWVSNGGNAAGDGTIEFDGSGTLDTGLASIQNVAITAGTRSVQSSIVSGTLTMTGGELDVQDAQTLTVLGAADLTGGTLSFTDTADGGSTERIDFASDVTLTATAGTMSPNSRLEVAGNWSSTSAWTPSAGTVAFDGGTVATVGGTSPTFHHVDVASGDKTVTDAALIAGDLTVLGGETLTTSAAIEVQGSVLLNALATWNLGLLTHTVHGDWTSDGATAADDGTIEFVSDGTLATGASDVPGVRVSAGTRDVTTSTVRLDLELTGGTLDVQDNATLTVLGDANLTAGTLSFTAAAPGDETLLVHGNVDLTAASGTTSATTVIEARGDWSSTSAWSPASGTVVLAPAAAATIDGTDPTFANLVLSTGTLDLLAAATVEDDFTVSSGVMFTTQAELDVNGEVTLGDATAAWDVGALTHTVQGGWTSAGASATGTGTVQLDGPGSAGTGGGSLPNLDIVSGPRSFSTTDITGDLTMSAGSIAILDDAAITVGGSATLTGGTLSFVPGVAGPEVLDVEGDVTIAGAVSGANSADVELYCAGNWSSDAGYAPGEGLLILDGVAPTTIGGAGLTLADVQIAAGDKTLLDAMALNDLEVVSGATLTASAVMSAAGQVVVGDATASIDLGGLTHSVLGDWTSSGGDGVNGTVDFGGDGTVATGAGSLANAVVSAGIRVAQDSTVTGDVTLTGGTLRIFDDATLHVLGNADLIGGTLTWFSVDQGGDDVLDVDGNVVCTAGAGNTTPSSVFRCAGDWTSDGNFAMPTGRVELDGAGTTSLSGAAPTFDPTFPTLLLRNGTRSVGNDVTMSVNQLTVEATGALDVTGVTAVVPANPINALGEVAIGAGGTLGLGATSVLLVPSGGTLRVLGGFGDPATVTGDAGGGYVLNIDGTLDASNFRFEQMGPSGVNISDSATIAQMIGGVFSEPSASAGSIMLEIRQNAPVELAYVDFEDPLGVGTNNVWVVGGANITLSESEGDFSGPAFEFDPLGIVDWISDPTAVASFTASAGADVVDLAWTSTTETDVASWVVKRATDPGGPFSELVTVPAAGPSAYAHADTTVASGQKYYYRLCEQKTFGEEVEHGSDDATPWTAGLPPTVLAVGPGGAFAEIQPAIDAAFPGAVVLIEPGTYAPFTVGPGSGIVRIYGDGTGLVTVDTTAAPVVIQGLGFFDAVEMSDLTIGDPASPNPGIEVLSCVGTVVLDELVVHGGAGQPGVRVSASTQVAIQRCDVDGTPGLLAELGSVAVVGRGTLDAAELTGSSSVRLAGLSAAQTVEAGSTLATLPGVHPDIDAPEVVSLGSTFPVTLDGEIGGPYGLAFSTGFGWFDLPSPPWEMVGLINILQAPVLQSGVLTGPTPLNLPVPPNGAFFGLALPMQMVVVNPTTFAFRWSNVTSILLGS
ncbi:MAG: hypothetical protein AAF682_16725 [Planctomycetota bacterium]